MHEIKIGTIVDGDKIEIIPELIGHGFETFAVPFWNEVSEEDLSKTADRLKEILSGTGCSVSCVSIYGNPLAEGAWGEAARASW